MPVLKLYIYKNLCACVCDYLWERFHMHFIGLNASSPGVTAARANKRHSPPNRFGCIHVKMSMNLLVLYDVFCLPAEKLREDYSVWVVKGEELNQEAKKSRVKQHNSHLNA